VIDKVQDARLSAGMKPLSFNGEFCCVFHFHCVPVTCFPLSQRRMGSVAGFPCLASVLSVPFSAVTLWVGSQENHLV